MQADGQALKQRTSPRGRADAWFDASLWPLLVVTLPQSQTDEDVERYLHALAMYRARKEPYAIVVNIDHSMGFTARQRRMQGEYIRNGIEESRLYLKGIAFVVTSSWRRGMLTAIFWIHPPPYGYEVFPTQEQAIDWAKSKLSGK